MREIIFRGRRVEDGEWIKGDLVHNTIDAGSRKISIGIQEDGCYPVEVIPETVGQFTGKEDVNKKRIFEGDILKDDDGELFEVKFGKLPLDKSGDCVCTYEAFYCKCYGRLGVPPTYECCEIGDWMVIFGSIHTTPELLK
jgi:hypothetical protein